MPTMRNLVLQTGSGAVAQLTEWLTNPTSVEGTALYILLAVLVGTGRKFLWDWYSEDDEEEVEFSDLLDEETIEQGAAERQLLDDIAESHKTVTAPGAVEWETRAARVGEQWTTTLYIANYPDYPNDGYLSELFEMTDVQFDLTAHITPKNQERARNELQDIADDLQVDADLEQSVRSAYLQERANEAAATYKAVENGANVFDQGMFITVRADEKDDLQDAVQTVKSALRDDPANLTPKTAICRQDLALQSAAPIGDNEFGRTSIALGGAVGALLSSPHNATILEEGGVEFGIHKDNQSPVVIDPFARDNGYA
ncbi:VirB4 family type IV secretion system protein, partial [Halobacterium salinarum]|nr:VirB4 family type IV secretion system protein [Halobacterium salinarum]